MGANQTLLAMNIQRVGLRYIVYHHSIVPFNKSDQTER